MGMEHWWNDTDRGNRNTVRETCHSTTVSTAILTRADLGSNLFLRFYRPATNCLSHDNASTFCCQDMNMYLALSLVCFYSNLLTKFK